MSPPPDRASSPTCGAGPAAWRRRVDARPAEITRTLADTPGPDLAPLLDQLAALHPPSTEAAEPDVLLAHAARTNQTWLCTVLSHLVTPDAQHVDQPTLTLLARIADHRHRWHISGPEPLGPASTTQDQALDAANLHRALHAATSRPAATELIEAADAEPAPGLGI